MVCVGKRNKAGWGWGGVERGKCYGYGRYGRGVVVLFREVREDFFEEMYSKRVLKVGSDGVNYVDITGIVV